jgi:fatty acid amide hydrolase
MSTRERAGSRLAGRPAGELAALIAEKQVSVREVVTAHLDRIARVDPALNAVVVRRDEQALAEADAADAAIGRGDEVGLLHGVPVTVKESLGLTGTPSTFGLPGLRSRPVESDDPYIARLRGAGAIVIGKTNVAQLLIAYESVNPVHGRTRNPWRLDRTPGGSSGGEAAIIAAGGSALGLGSDILGSVRIPAAFTGIAAFKPTAGRTPDRQRGSIPLGQQAIVSQIGPLATTVADLTLALRVITGTVTPDGDPVPPQPAPDASALPGLGVAVWTSSPAGGDSLVTAAPAVARAADEAAAALHAAATRAREWTPPDVPDALATIFGIMGADQGRGLARTVGRDPIAAEIRTFYRGISSGRVAGGLARTALRRLGQHSALPTVAHAGRHHADDYWRLVDTALQYRRRVHAELDAAGVDLIVAPVHAAPALPHGTGVYSGPGGLFAMWVNLLGYPAGVVPVTTVQPGEDAGRPAARDRGIAALAAADTGSAGLPVGIQVIGRPGRDHLVLAALAAIEAEVRRSVHYPRPENMEVWS